MQTLSSATQKAVALAALVFLAGCDSPMAPQHDQAACMRFGFQQGTDGMASCMMQRDAQRRSAAQAFHAQRPTACQRIGNAIICD